MALRRVVKPRPLGLDAQVTPIVFVDLKPIQQAILFFLGRFVIIVGVFCTEEGGHVAFVVLIVVNAAVTEGRPLISRGFSHGINCPPS